MIKRVLLAAAGITALASVQSAYAQEASSTGAPPSDQSKPGGEDEGIIVTGSRLKSEVPVGSAIISLSRKDIENSNALTTSQLFLNLPQVNNFGVTQNSRSGNGGSANFTFSQGLNIHGIGPYATLMLVDGQRLISQGGYGLIVSDTSVIPTIALERVEVVADGASAIYGSDAVAGVANLILRRHFKGIEASATYGGADNYNQYQASIIAGHDWGSGHAMLAYSYSGNSNLTARDRSFARSDLRGSGGSDFRSTLCNPGNINIGGVRYAIPAGGVTPGTAGQLQPNTSNRCDNSLDSDLVPEVRRHNIVATLDQDLTGGLSLHATAFYSHRAVEDRLGLSTATLTVPSSNAFFVRPAGTVGPETVNYAFSELPETAFSNGRAEIFHSNAGVSLKLPKDWLASADFTYDVATDFLTQNAVLAGPLAVALASSDPATAFNPYGVANSASVLAVVGNGANSVHGTGHQWVADLALSGTLFDLPAGAVGLAIGYQHQFSKRFAFGGANTKTAPTYSTNLDARRNVDSAYAEVKLPLLNDIPGIYRLTLDAAIRYDSFSDVGSTSNPKFGVDWEVVKGLRLHGSYSTSFRAPGLYHVAAPAQTYYTTLADPQAGNALVNVIGTVGGAAAAPETARTYSFGADFKPAAVPGLTAQLTYFDIHYDNVIASFSNNPQLLSQSYYANLGILTRNPTPAQIAAFLALGPTIPGVVPPSIQILADTRARNAGSVRAAGLDYVVTYEFTIGKAGTFNVGSSGTRYLNYKTAVAPGAPFVDLLGAIQYPNKFQARAYVGWQLDRFNMLATANHSNSYNNNLVVPVQKVSDYTTLDLHLGYDLSRFTPLSKLRASLDFTNIFNRHPPFVNIGPSNYSEGGFDTTQANPVGRVIAFTLTAAY